MRHGRPLSRRVVRRRAVAALVTAAVGVAAWAGTAYWLRGTPDATPTTSRTTAATGSTTTTTTTTTSRPVSVTVPTRIGAFTFGQTTLSLVEPGANGSPARQLPTAIWYPRPKGAPRGATAPDRADGPYPLLAFSQGFWTNVSQYQTLLASWASAGYVVVAPTYPTTEPDPAIAGTAARVNLREDDIVDHPNDLRFVIDAIVTKAGRPGWVLSGLVDRAEIGLVGQSDGGDVSLALADNSRFEDPTVKAVAVLSGAEFGAFGGSYFAGPHSPPLLAVQNPSDQVNPAGCSVALYNQAPQPKWYLQLQGLTGKAPAVGHLGPYTTLTTYVQVIGNVTTYFFDAELAGQHGALATMTLAGDAPGLAQLSDGTSAPTPTGPCTP